MGTSGSAGGLLERDGSIASLRELLDLVRSEKEGRLVLVGGEAGVGKTTLLRAFCTEQPAGVRVLWGACEPLRTPRPLGPLADIADELGGDLQTLVSGIAKPYEVGAALLHELRGRTPTVVVLEDIHWADEATLDVLSMLAAKARSVPVLVLASYRDEELDRAGQLRVLMGELVRSRGRLKLAPLSSAAVAELAAPFGIDGDELHRHTGGNPFFVTEVLATVGARIPDTVRDAVLARAGRLSDPAMKLLEAVAVVPGQVDMWLLELLAGGPLDSLEECLAAGMLRATGPQVAFRHELARLAIEEAISPARRVALHRSALAALSRRARGERDFARLAEHAEAAGDVTAVLKWAPLAAERAASSGAHRESAAQYGRALRYADGLPDQERAALLQARARECYMTAQIEVAVEAQEEAVECHRRVGDRLAEGDALRVLSRLLFFAARVDEGEPLARAAVTVLEELPAGHELAMAYGNLSQRRMVVEDLEAAVSWGARALELGERLDDTEAIVYALTNVGCAETQAGIEEAAVKLERALELAQAAGLEEHAGRIYQSLVVWPLRQRRFDLVDRYLETGLAYTTEHGLDTWRLYLLALKALGELTRGRWDAGADAAELVLRNPRSAPVARAWSLTALGLLRARRGDADALGPLLEAEESGAPTGEPMRIVTAAVARAELGWLTGSSDAVVEATDRALALALERRGPWLVGELAYWRWQAGVREELPAELLAEPYRLAMTGESRRAAELWRRLGCPYEAALALADTGDPDSMREAVDELQQLGARPAAAIVARRMRERGVRGIPRGPRARTRENPAGLTVRELDVLELLADGMRNAQIAERLVVSQKTVDHHVSAILRKLDVESRGEASAKAGRLGILRSG